MDLKEALEEAKSNLFHITNDIQWAYHDGFRPYGSRNLEGTSGANGFDRNENLGNYKAREAFRTASTMLRSADIRLAAALWTTGVRFQPTLINPTDCSLIHVLDLITHLRWRLIKASESQVLQKKNIEDSLNHIYRVRMNLHSVFEDTKLSSELEPSVQFCRICGIREREHGSRCHTCYVYKLRHEGEERPRTLDNGSRPYEEAMEARKRHGLGYGAR